MGDVGVEFHLPQGILLNSVLLKRRPTVIAVSGPQMVLIPALGTVVAHLSGGHSYKISAVTLDDLDLPDDKFIVDSHGTKGPQLGIPFGHELDSDFGNLHGKVSLKHLPWIVGYDQAWAGNPLGQDLLLAFDLQYISAVDDLEHRRTTSA